MNSSTQFLRTNAAQRTLALVAIVTMATVPAMAANRTARPYAVAHPVGHVVATHSQAAREHGHHAAHLEPVDDHRGKHGKKSNAGKALVPPAKAHIKETHRRRREPEIVDEPVLMHRAKAKGRKLSKRERAQQLAEAHYETARRTYAAARPAPVRPVVVAERADESSRYATREFAASYENASRKVGEAARPNAYARQAQGAAIGTALRSSPEQNLDNGEQQAEPANDPISDQARRSSVVVRRPAPQAQISAAETPLPVQRYQPRVAQGFGAEVAPLPRNPAASQALSTEAQDLGEDLAANGVPSARTLANDAMQPLVTPMYTRDGNLMMPAPLRGSHEILVHQNTMADRDGLERIRDDNQLNRLRAERQLINFPESASLRINEALPENRRVARPWTVQFAVDTARAFYQRFGEPLQINSAVRTVSYQLRLQRVNGNAAATRGDAASPHLTGQAIDFAKRGLTAEEIGWMRTYLLPFIDAGKVDVEEEFQQACFHISVYRSYAPVRRQAMQVAQIRPLPATAATVLPGSADTDQ